ncbi:unnamed protein product, partial [Prorocentrum cordatum]
MHICLLHRDLTGSDGGLTTYLINKIRGASRNPTSPYAEMESFPFQLKTLILVLGEIANPANIGILSRSGCSICLLRRDLTGQRRRLAGPDA